MESTNVLMVNEEDGDTKSAQNQNPEESTTLSPCYSLEKFKNMLKRGQCASDKRTGRVKPPTDSYLCMMSMLLLCSSAGLTAISGWLIIYRLPVFYLTNGSFFMGSTSFTLFGCLISIPCCWIAWMSHFDRKYTLLPLLIVALGFSIAMLSIGISIGLVYKTKVSFDKTVHPPQLRPSYYKTELNKTMSTAMALYSENFNYRYGWDKIQQRLKCCGIEGPRDWMPFGQVPNSCFIDSKCRIWKFTYVRGCLDVLSYDLAWEICLVTGLSMVTLVIQLITLFVAIIAYINQKVEPGNGDGL